MSKIKAYLFIAVACCFFSWSSFALPVSTDTLLAKHIALLKQKQTTFKKTLDTLRSSQVFSEETLKKDMLLNKMQRLELQQTIQFSETEKADLLSRQKILKKHLDSPTVIPNENARMNLDEINQDLTVKEEEISLLKQNQTLLKAIKDEQEVRFKKIIADKAKEGWAEKTEALKEEVQHLKEKADRLLNEKTALFTKEDNTLNSIEQQIKSNLLTIESNIAKLEIKRLNLVIKLYYSKEHELLAHSLPVLTYKLNLLNEITQSLDKTKHLQQGLSSDLKAKPLIWETYYENKELTETNRLVFLAKQKALTKEVDVLGAQLERLNTRTKALIQKLDKERGALLSLRQGLLSFDMPHWKKFFSGLFSIPEHFMSYLYALVFRIQAFIALLPIIKQLALGLLVIVLILFWYTGKKLFTQLMEKEKRFVLGEDLLHVLTRLFKRNWGVVCFFIGILLLFNLAGLGLTSYKLIVMLFAVWFSFRAIIGIIRLALLETESDVDGHDVALYYRLRWTFIIGGVVTLLLVLSLELNIGSVVTDILNRLFMLFLFAVSIVLLIGRHVILMLLKSFLKPKRIYVKRALSLFTVIAPIALMMNAMIGLIGYAFLAWEMSYYLLVLVLGLVGYVVVRGILNDTMSILAEYCIQYTRNGWLWTEVFLKPIHRILKIALFIGFITIIIILCGWDTQTGLLLSLNRAWQFHIFNFSRVDITIGSFIEFTILVSLFIWAAKWTRECCFRWLYRHVRDVGIRNSFSVFTQYLVVTVGTIITLRVLGVDVSGLSMILGGLAVGMGFGLRDFANNIIGGLMLLIERPVKEGDLISVDNFEGVVTHIGIRALRVRSWDHMEVMIPNAKTFSSPFTNWTHQDDVVRTVIPIKLSRQDSPVEVQTLIFDLLAIIPEVLHDPAPQVYLKHIDEALIEFEVRYFIDIKAHSRMEVRSIVLLALTAQFKAAGIKPPIPPISIENLTSCKA